MIRFSDFYKTTARTESADTELLVAFLGLEDGDRLASIFAEHIRTNKEFAMNVCRDLDEAGYKLSDDLTIAERFRLREEYLDRFQVYFCHEFGVDDLSRDKVVSLVRKLLKEKNAC